MTFKKRTTDKGILGSSLYNWASERTGVPMPNCFTYATFRISEILNAWVSLDGDTKVRGAGDLWETHAPDFEQSKYATLGALMIFKGGSGNYGHVAVVEDIINANTISWSESNYGANMFGYLTKNPNGYAGLQFMGYLVHKDLAATNNIPSQQPLKYKVGTPVCVTSGYTTPFGKYLLNEHYEGTITQIEANAPYPYKVDSKMWVNDALIDNDPHTPGGLKVGGYASPITPYDYNGSKLIDDICNHLYTIIEISGDRVVLGDGLITAFKKSNLK